MLRSLLLGRSWHHISSVHLIHKKDPPLVTHHYSSRGLLVHPTPSPQEVFFTCFSWAPAQPLLRTSPIPSTFYPAAVPVPPANPTVRATRKSLKTSVKKIFPLMFMLKRLQVEDAISRLDSSVKKPAEWIKKVVQNAIRSAVHIRGMHEERLYIKEAILSRNTPIYGLRRQAKGRGYRSTKPRTQVTIILEERTVEQVYTEIMTGTFSPSLSSYIRNHLLHEDASYGDLRQHQNLLTAKGRQQQKLMLKRKVSALRLEYLKQNLVIPPERIQQELLDRDCKEFVDRYWAKKRAEAEKRIAERLELYKRNEGIK